ncbi:MAG: DnaJ domain-containing protein [Acidobacteria bacterium]|nr:DnaJ domain-containing protein [Acidobacteriota bacterium]NIM63967.1 DnaJ domain-containing protein [Acidobacteriota bacterium]NIO59372.1 DnaJ domain-containing protein [Acidobacteriota bacterium]NIQ30408.1 DnaJ domain-containing protein [Acidobacteriota bacterium]NIQ85334.1 DnaJ domain-containing protein [Acidobacteriota bacterium]
MSEQTTTRGAIEAVLVGHAGEASSGILTITDGKVRRLFVLAEGRLIHSASNLIEEQLESFLANEGYLNPDQRARLEQQLEDKKIPVLQWLRDEELLEPDKLEAAIAAHAGAVLLAGLCSREPEAAFQAGAVNLEGKPVTAVAPTVVLFEYLKEHPKSPQAVRSRIGNVALHPTRVAARESDLLALAESHPIVGEIWKHCDGDLTFLQVASAIGAGQERAMRALYGLTLVGMVEGISRKQREQRRIEDVPVTRNELMMRLDKAVDANHYGVLELSAQADEDEIRRSYYLLARRYHPDRFRAGELRDLLPRIEAFFSQVTEAYNTLADTELREQYDETLRTEDKRQEEAPEHDTSHLARQNFVAAKALIGKKQFRQAIKFLENALELEENIAEYHVEFGKVIGLNPVRREEAEEHLRRGLELDPTVMDAHVALADLLVKREKKKNAVAILKEALKWFPDRPEIRQRLEKLDGKAGRGLFGR